MAPSVNHLGEETSIKILYATENKRAVGIAPFRKTHKKLKGKIGYTIIEPLTFGNTDYTGLILAEQEEYCLSKFLVYLFNQKDWDLFYLPHIPQTSLTLKLLEANQKSLPAFDVEKGCICPYVTIPDSKEKLLKSLTPKFRKELKRRMHKLEGEKGTVRLKHYHEFGSLEQGMETLFNLHQKSWALRGKPGAFKTQEARNIALQTAKFFDERDWLRLYFLTLNNKPIAAELALEYGGRMYGHLCGFDPDYSVYSLGNLLLLKVFEDCIERGVSEYDFMQGAERYKFFWTSKFRQTLDIRFVNSKFSSNLIAFACRTLRVSPKLSVLINMIKN
jgi:CelD/BcsL family acetyltransferase involved in cellulose biosynthesis